MLKLKLSLMKSALLHLWSDGTCAALCRPSFLHLLFTLHNSSLMLSCFLDFWYLMMSVHLTLINFNHFRLSPVTVFRILSPKSLHNFKGCLCLWTHKGLSKPGLYHFLFMSVCSSFLVPSVLVLLHVPPPFVNLPLLCQFCQWLPHLIPAK